MLDTPAHSHHSVSSLQRWQSFKNVGGCMGAFSQMFHLNRMLGGLNNYLASQEVRSQNLGRKNRHPDVEKQSSLRGERAEESIDLRQILDAKQEPFVLQDVIWEKRHPVRTRSSRELKPELNDIVPSTNKSQSSKRSYSKENRKHSDVSRNDDLSAPSRRIGGASSALVKGKSVPAESMVALPSSPASTHARKTRSLSSKTSSAGKSPVKSPNKRALLMEAAAKILEGSNRRASRLHSSSARSLLRELDGSKQAQELLKLKEAPMKRSPLGDESTVKQESLLQNVTSEEKQVELSKKQSNADKSFSFVSQFHQDSPNRLISSSEMTDEEVIRIMQSRIYPSDGMPAARGELSQLATMADSSNVPQKMNHIQGPNVHFSKVDRTQEERLITLADVSIGSMHRSADLRSADKQKHQGMEFVMVSESIGRNHRQLDKDISVDRNKDLESALYVDSINITFDNELQAWNIPSRHCQEEISKDTHQFPMSRKESIDDIDCSINAARSGICEVRIEDSIDAYTYTLSDIDSGLLNSCKSAGTKRGITKEITSEKLDITESAPTPVLLLCNYSWWTQEEIQASSTLKNEASNECVGHESPIIATKGPCVVKIFEERKEGQSLEEVSSTSSDHSYTEELQQSSPVSVLDMVYDGSPILGKPFDYFDEARQKLLESVRRYEMLAHMDLDTLIKLNEESLCHEFEEECDTSSFKESLGSDSTDICAAYLQVPLMGSPDYQLPRSAGFSNVEAESLCVDSAYGSLYGAAEDDLYIHSDEDLYMQQSQVLADEDFTSTSDYRMDARATFKAERESRRCKASRDCSSEPLDLDALKGPLRQSLQTASMDTLDEVDRLTGSVIINAILHMDMTTSSWSSFHEEVEVMEVELESSLFAALMQELFYDLLC